jgi:hypothetical protein
MDSEGITPLYITLMNGHTKIANHMISKAIHQSNQNNTNDYGIEKNIEGGVEDGFDIDIGRLNLLHTSRKIELNIKSLFLNDSIEYLEKVYMCIYLYIFIHMHTVIYIYMHLCMHVYTYMHKHIYIFFLYVCLFI